MDLVIKQSISQQESVTSELLDKLYNLTKPGTTGQPAVNAVLVGRLEALSAYEDAVTFLNTQFSVSQDNGSDLRVFVLNNNYYIRFADSAVEEVLRLSMGKDEGEGITTSEAATANISNTFKDNTDIVSFNEFKYFTAQQGRSTSFQGCTSLERIDVSDCTNIKGNMFDGCRNLEYFHGANSVQGALIISDGLSTIGGYAFRNCLGITALTLHGNITIALNAFVGCSNLNAIYIDSLDDWLSITFTFQPLQYAHNLYINGSLVQNVTIPAGTDLANKFWGSTSLESVVIESGVTSIGNSAFQSCTALTSIIIPDNLTSIGAQAFPYCSSLTSINIPSGVTGIGNNAFERCTNLVISDLNLPNLTSLGNVAFYQTKVQQISDLGNITSIPTQAFDNCYELSSVSLSNNITGIGQYAFRSCRALTTITIPSGVTSIGSDAFNGCSSLVISDLNLPNLNSLGGNAFKATKIQQVSALGSITSIPSACFDGCTALASITLPNSVTSIGNGAFNVCTALASINIPSGVTTIGKNVFWNCTNLIISNLDLPNLTSLGDGAFRTIKVQQVSALGSVTSVPPLCFNSCSALTSVVLPNTITSIGHEAFTNCTALTTINIPNSVTTIGYSAFYMCSSLTSVNIPDSMTSIGNQCFDRCTSLTSITIPNSVTSIGDAAFRSCSGLTDIIINATIPPTIGPSTFNNTNCPIYVPAGSVSAYQSAPNWSTYASRIQTIQE